MKNLFHKISAYILAYTVVIGLMILAIGLGYRGRYFIPKQSNIIVIIVGVIIIAPFLFYVIFLIIKIRKEKTKNTNSIVYHNKRVIELSSIKIIEYNYKNIDYYTSKIGEYEAQNLCYKRNNFIIEIPLNGIKKKYSFDTDKNLDDIRIHFVLQKQATLFLDKNNNILKINLPFLN